MLFRCGRRAADWPAPGVVALLLALVLVASVPTVPARASSVLTLNPGLGLHTADRAVTIPVLAFVECPDGEAVGHSLSFDTILIGRNQEPRIRVGLLEDVPGGIGAGLRHGDVWDRLAALRYFWRAEFMAQVMTDLVR